MPNHLSGETSLYLLDHQTQPVNWYPWGEDALTAAKAHNKPILLSIGYATNPWCELMAKESFADPATAQIMNEHFIKRLLCNEILRFKRNLKRFFKLFCFF